MRRNTGLLVDLVSGTNGADGRPNTADDVTTQRSSYGYDAQGELTRLTSYRAPGPDGQWRTADDVVNEYYDSTFVDGHVTMTANFGLGPDGVPFTADDYRRSITLYDPSV